MKTRVVILVLLFTSCATGPLGQWKAPRIHLYDVQQDGYASGTDSNSLFVVVGTNVMPPSAVRITLVATADKHYPAAKEGEYCVDAYLPSASRFDGADVFLFHSDRAGNAGAFRLGHTQEGKIDWISTTNEEETRFLSRLCTRLAAEYKSLDEMPAHTRRFVNYYCPSNSMPFPLDRWPPAPAPVPAKPEKPRITISSHLPSELRERIEQLDHPNPRRRIEAIRSLATMGGKAAPAIPFLLARLLDEEWADAAPDAGRTHPGVEVARALGQIGKEAVPALLEILQDPKRNINERLRAEQALGCIRDSRAKQALISALKDDRGAIREGAAWALGQMADKDAVIPLCQALANCDPYVQRAVAGALAKLADPRALDPLIEALGRKPTFAEENIVLALENINDPRAVNAIRAAIKSDPVRSYGRIVHALDKIVENHFDHFFPNAREIVVSPLTRDTGTVPRIKVTIREDEVLCFKPDPDLARHRGIAHVPDLLVEPAGNAVDERSRLIDYVFFKPFGPGMLHAQNKGRALRVHAVRPGQETIRLFFHGGIMAEQPSLIAEVTITPQEGEVASTKALDSAADKQHIAALGAVTAKQEGFVKNVLTLRATANGDPDPARRRMARTTISAMSSEIAAWLQDNLEHDNRDPYTVHLIEACGEERIKEAIPILERIAVGQNADVRRAAAMVLAILKSDAHSQGTGTKNRPNALGDR